MDNNLALRTPNSFSSENATYPLSNTRDSNRAKVWKPTGCFVIDGTINTIYINDGSDKDVVLTEGTYTAATLATHIQTQLNASSSGWTVSYSTTTNKFTISRSSSATLRLSGTTGGPIWNTIGFTTTTDIVGTSWTGDQSRLHTSEYIIWDLGAPRDVTFFSAIGPIGQTFSISRGATVKLMGNNINDFTSPPFDETLTVTDEGIFSFFDGEDDYSYRYWKFQIVDYYNTEEIQISYIYLGDYFTFDNDRTVSFGFEKALLDPSVSSESENSTLYFDTRTKFSVFGNIGLELLKRDHKYTLEAMFKIFGKTNPFFISIDPTNAYTDNLEELTKFVYFNEEPRFRHVMKDLFSCGVSFREVV